MKKTSIAIDGPSGAGKSSLAKSVAAELHYLYVDTGAIYRTVGYYAFANEIDPADEEKILAALPQIRIELRYGEDGLQHMLLNGTDVTGEIRLPQVSLCASAVSAYSGVRAFLLDMQRNLARTHDVVMDGRDIGTVVLPDAEVKIFLTASPEARARRRWEELKGRGMPEPFEKILKEIEQRDYNDTHRAVSPLRRAEDAAAVDTTLLNFEQSKQAILELVRERLNQ